MATANPSSNFTRPNDTTAYTSGDLVANNVTNTSVVPLSWLITSNIYGLLEARGAYTPGAQEVFTITLETVSQNF